LALALIAFLVVKQLDSSSSNNQAEKVTTNNNIDSPAIPTSPKDLQKFEQDIDKFILDNADSRAKKLEESLEN